MTEAPLLQFCDAQFRLIAKLVFDGEGRGDAPAAHARPDLLIPELISICNSARDALEAMQNAYIFRRIKRTYPIFVVARELLPNMISLLERLRRHYRRLAREGAPPDRLDDLDAAVNRFRASVEQFFLKWPWFDLDQMEKSSDDYDLSKSQDAREFLNELLHQARQRSQGEDRLVEPTTTTPQ